MTDLPLGRSSVRGVEAGWDVLWRVSDFPSGERSSPELALGDLMASRRRSVTDAMVVMICSI